MKRRLFMALALMMWLGLPNAHVEAVENDREVWGRWTFVGLLFEGRRYDRPNPDLRVEFTFNSNGTHQLRWHRVNEIGFCERRGPYRVQQGVLWQKVSWLNPNNESECGRDPDMQLDRETENYVTFQGDELGISMDLDGKELIYLLKRIAP